VRTLVKVMAHGVKLQAVTALITPVFRGRPDKTMFRIGLLSLCGQRAMVRVAEHLVLMSMCGGAPVTVELVQSHDGGHEYTEVPTDEAPPDLRALMRFTMAAGQRDHEMAWAVWCSVPRKRRAGLMAQLTHMAYIHLQSHMGDDDTEPPQWTEDNL